MASIRSTFFKLFNSAKYTNYFTPETQLELLKQYRNSIGLSSDLDFGVEDFDNYMKNRFQDHKSFKTLIPTTDNKKLTLEEALAKEPETSEAFKKIFTQNDKLLTAAQKYKEEIKHFQELVKNERHSVETYRNRLEKIYDDALKTIEEQHKRDLENLEAILTSDLTQKIKCKTPSVLKTNLKAELEQAKENDLNHLKKSTQEYLTRLDKASNREREQTLYTAHLVGSLAELSTQKRRKMQEEIERARNENRARFIGPSDQEPIKWDIKNHSIQAVNPKDLNFIISMTGQKIQHDKGSDTWSVDFSPRLFNPLYYANPKHLVRVETLTIASAIKASGFEKITMDLNFKNEKTALKRAKEAYRACLETGFEPAKIIINVNGRTMKTEELFKDEPSLLQQLQQEAKEDRKKLSEGRSQKKPSTEDIATTARKDMAKLRAEKKDESNKSVPENKNPSP